VIVDCLKASGTFLRWFCSLLPVELLFLEEADDAEKIACSSGIVGIGMII